MTPVSMDATLPVVLLLGILLPGCGTACEHPLLYSKDQKHKRGNYSSPCTSLCRTVVCVFCICETVGDVVLDKRG